MSAATLLVELGTEELPPKALKKLEQHPGLFSAEAAVETVGYFVAYSAFIEHDKPLWHRARALLREALDGWTLSAIACIAGGLWLATRTGSKARKVPAP